MDSQFVQPIGTYTATPQGPLGQKVWSERRCLLYGRFLDAVTYTTGHVCCYAGTVALPYQFTNDVDGTNALLRFAGVVPNAGLNGVAVTAVPSQNDYGYIQIEGPHSAVLNDDTDFAAGDTAIMISTDGTCQRVAAATTTGSLLYVGFAPAAITATTGALMVKSLIW